MEIDRICKIIKEKISINEFGEIKDILANEVVVTKDSIIEDIDSSYMNNPKVYGKLTNRYYNVSRKGDILVGFYLEPNYDKKELTLSIIDKHINQCYKDLKQYDTNTLNINKIDIEEKLSDLKSIRRDYLLKIVID